MLIIEFEKPELKDPVLVQGLPGVGFVGKIALDFFIEELKPLKIAEAYSTYLTLPDGDVGVKVGSNGAYTLPKYEFYVYQDDTSQTIFLTGDTQPSPWGQYRVAEEVLDFVGGYGCKTVIALGGYSTPQNLEAVYAICNDLTLIDDFRSRVKIARGGVIKGAFGVLLGLGQKRGMNCLGLLGATRGVYPDPLSSRNVVQVVADMLNLPVDLKGLDKNIADVESKMKRLQRIRRGVPKQQGQGRQRELPGAYII
ncbi:MAG: PAC2 family protein [Candidatus Bathyarchaeia archaeon]